MKIRYFTMLLAITDIIGMHLSGSIHAVEKTGRELLPKVDLVTFPLAKPTCELRLALPAKLKPGQRDFKVSIHNSGTTSLSLVMPGDGSISKRRTPIIGWSIIPEDSDEDHPQTVPPFRGGICAFVNPLKADEIFTLKPNESKLLNEWASFPTHNLKPGLYRVVFYYSNDPQLNWIGHHQAELLQKIRLTTPITLKSNEVEVEITQ